MASLGLSPPVGDGRLNGERRTLASEAKEVYRSRSLQE